MDSTLQRSPRRPWRFPVYGLLAFVAGLPAAVAAESANAWLERMASAVSNLTYRGTLVYVRHGQVDTLKIYHRVDETGMRERLVALSGAPREVLRDNDTVRCIFPERESVLVDTRIAERLFPTFPTDLNELSSGSYEFALSGVDRVATHEAQVLSIAARDGLRYGYRLWLERNTGMLLKSALLDKKGNAIEQLLFTEIEIGATISERELEPDVPSEGYVEIQLPRAPAVTPAPGQDSWTLSKLPSGFQPVSRRRADGVVHFLFSDGLAAVSVYVEPVASGPKKPSGYSQIGAMNIYGQVSGGMAVTAVGEVPRPTLKMLVSSVTSATVQP
ncbi:MAG: MucB/RseB C-terminal domain-containing protein [Pseudomonadota bacterium]